MTLLIKELRWFGLLMVTVAVATGLPGCGSSPDAGKFARVSGKVTFKGEPLADATVTFAPVDMSNNAEPAEGKTDSAGSYFMTRQTSNDGATIGMNHVVIQKSGPPKPNPLPLNQRGDPQDTEVPGDPLIPEKYFSSASSGLQFDVKAGNNTDANFDLTE